MALFISNNKYFIFLLFIIAIACLLGRFFAFLKKRKPIKKGSYFAVNILTKNEYSFYMKLRSKINQDILIFPKVRMEDLINVNNSLDNSNRTKYRNYIKSRHLDFVIADKSLHILCAVELDDSSHFSSDAKINDKLKDDILKSVSIPLFRGYNNPSDIKRISSNIDRLFLESGL